MKTIQRTQELRDWRASLRLHNRTLGFVPTMGNLHEGHLSLIRAIKPHCDAVVVSIFVNPAQFNEEADFDSYPRTLDADLHKLREQNVDAVFAPPNSEVYPVYPPRVTVKAGATSQLLCGKSRAGHFDGVVTVVSKLFNLVEPDVSAFGQKDFQQLAVIREMVADLNFGVQVLGVPTKRSDKGLALSSRNGLLSAEQLTTAPAIFETLCWMREQATRRELPTDQIIERATGQLTRAGFLVDYVELLSQQLTPLSAQTTQVVALIAAKLGSVRLIDNLCFERSLSFEQSLS